MEDTVLFSGEIRELHELGAPSLRKWIIAATLLILNFLSFLPDPPLFFLGGRGGGHTISGNLPL